MADKTVRIQVELTDQEAWQFAQFLKRADYEMFAAKTEVWLSDAERKDVAYSMVDAAEKVRTALAEAGYNTR